ncbi:MAG: U32 family peptidase [Bacilli bacterium]|nr:U32 family peptidase [Bacilli bacterium]
MSRIEILAPAGNYEALISAIKAGADAVYLGGISFGARAYASNFDNEKIIEAIQYAHLHNVKVFVTVNTLIDEDEFNKCLTFIDFLVKQNVDGLIIQDFGLLKVVREIYPTLYLVASTQMNIHNVEGAQMVKLLGANRVVLARETSLDIAKEIADKVDIDVEVFAHGAICISYSGQCLMSSFIGKRSGNKGKCAQPCRLDYVLMEDKKEISDKVPLLSSKDLMTLEHLEQICDSKIKSLKIEGRMKSKEYVYVTVKAYRKALDGLLNERKLIIDKDDIIDIKKTFNREFTKGFLLNDDDTNVVNIKTNNHQGIRIGKVIGYHNGKVKISLFSDLKQGDGIRLINNDKECGFIANKIYLKGKLVNGANKGNIIEIESKYKMINGDVLKTLDIKLNEEIAKHLLEEKRLPINFKLTAHINHPIVLEAFYNDIHLEVKSTYLIEKAQKEIDDERIKQQLAKLGNSHYFLAEFSLKRDEYVLLPLSVLNDLKNQIVSKMDEMRLDYIPKAKKELSLPNIKVKKELGISVSILTLEQYEAIKDIKGIKIIVPPNLYKLLNDRNLILDAGRVINTYSSYDHLLINDFGGYLSNSKNKIVSPYLNVKNVYSLIYSYYYGASKVTLSLENSYLNTKQIYDDFVKMYSFEPNLEIVVYGRNDLMLSKYCPIHKVKGINNKKCQLCHNHQYYLKDRFNFLFPLIGTNNCDVVVLNNRVINLIDEVKKIKQIASLRLIFTVEGKEEVKKIVNAFINAYNEKESNLDLIKYHGYFDEGVN